jgi:hypothetical protein
VLSDAIGRRELLLSESPLRAGPDGREAASSACYWHISALIFRTR